MNRKIFISIICVLFAALASYRGFAFKEQRVTDEYSESQAFNDALSISRGEHRYGLVNYTHYPNGPSYILVVPMKMGVLNRSTLRTIPVVVSVACLTILILGLLVHLSNWLPATLAVAGVGSLLWQPGVIEWMGSLHEHAYALALCFAGAGLALLPNVPRLALMLVAFIQGWIGYDFTFAFFMCVVACRWLVHTRRHKTVSAFKSLVIDGLCTGVGTLAAIGTHLMQNTYYFGSYQAAIKDLVGSAAARAGLDVAKEMNIGYVHWLQSYSKGQEVTRLDLVVGLLTEFLSGKWMHTNVAAILTVAMIAILAAAVAWKAVRAQISGHYVKSLSLHAIVALAMTVMAGVTWILVMPQHARYHFFFLPRHFFVPLLVLWIALCSMIDRVMMLRSAKDELA
jgi:hypothetical protein